jgi:dihydropteroate synthase
MGIVNATPNSFYANSRAANEHQAVAMAQAHLEAGATILDIGAVSTRPNAEIPDEKTELERLVPLVKAINRAFPQAVLSVDTFRAKVLEAAFDVGASILNDVSGTQLDPELIPMAARLKVPYILMHFDGSLSDIHQRPKTEDLFLHIFDALNQRIHQLQQADIYDIIIDPGFGFNKSLEDNYLIFNRLEDFKALNQPLLVGISRKSMVWKLLNSTPEDIISATTALHLQALLKGANIIRTHDVKEVSQAIRLAEMLVR